MDRNMKRHEESDSMEPTEIDRILATEEALIPSSGFLASVMEQVQEEAATPAPIPFPWRLAVPAMVLAVGVLGWGAFELGRAALPAMHEISMTAPHLSGPLVRPLEEAGWVALALAVSLAASLFSRRLAGRSGLL
jgi:hypothetical protein